MRWRPLRKTCVRLGAQAVLLKGGHFARRLGGGCAVDSRCTASAQASVAAHCHAQRAWHRVHAVVRHCGHLALGLPLQQAVEKARSYILGAIAAGADADHGARPMGR